MSRIGFALVLTLVALTAAAGASAVRQAAATRAGAVSVRPLAVTSSLRAALREGYYAAYRSDRHAQTDYGAPPGLPLSAVLGPYVSDAAVLSAGGTSTSWVVAGLCVHNPVACQDAGGFQIFERSGSSGPFQPAGGLCNLPEPLLQRWFPHAVLPLGMRCPAGTALVPRSGERTDSWHALLPSSWRRGVSCQNAASAISADQLCSFEGGDTDVEVWYNPAAPGERFVVVTCRGGGCDALAASGGPRLLLPTGATLLRPGSATGLSFAVGPQVSFPERHQDGSGEIDVLLAATNDAGKAVFPLYTVSVALPATESATARTLLATFSLAT